MFIDCIRLEPSKTDTIEIFKENIQSRHNCSIQANHQGRIQTLAETCSCLNSIHFDNMLKNFTYSACTKLMDDQTEIYTPRQAGKAGNVMETW